ncbi:MULTISPECIES: OPT/YSL family transporter [unclassified Mesotoga]|uniref:OPT/YSL family transporter n=1 Tax=unclassified Mesotoga TaxID=1184398 RepID=UPI000EF2901F|nr:MULTISPECIES: OPT/YSL family transporter [unclassified Mesotoga]MDD3682210.1 OPT/YSL family transporter [Mesotoga sp.]MDD4207961.1 OPT/YSL family transporter [Mesotoga sp.]MDD4825237.1 OPT/YSL family transporter [Mesotoga sp.]RLL81521.1 peptide transporter [Mesotoga sp. BH458_6_3_2_1]
MRSNEVSLEKGSSKQLTVRSLVIGALGSIIITTSSMYVALRMGALPWPTIFVAVMSLAILKALGGTNLNEINVTHTAMSSGAMVAGGLAFTVPGIWILEASSEVSFLSLLIVTLAGTILGVIFTGLIRRYFIEKEKLPFPMGVASYETVVAGDKGGKKAKYLFSTMGAAAVFVAVRDGLEWIPSAWSSVRLYSRNIFFGMWISPMAVGIGYIIGPLFTGVWFLGAVLSYFFLIPVGVAAGWFADVGSATAFKDSLGIGLMVGTGVGILLKGILPRAREIYLPVKSSGKGSRIKTLRWIPLVFAAIALFLTTLTEMTLVSSLLTIVGVWLTTAMAASITGQSGINPMEIFGIIILIAVKSVASLGTIEAFLVAGVVAVACGLAGDVLNDFKSGYLLKTNPRAQIIAETVGGVIGAVVSVIVLFIMFRAYGTMGPGTELPAPQAYAVSTMVGGLPNTPAFFFGLMIGILIYLMKLPGMTLGIGMYLPMEISTAAFVGGVISFIVGKVKPKSKETGLIVSSGLLGGEGITGVVLAIIRVLTVS